MRGYSDSYIVYRDLSQTTACAAINRSDGSRCSDHTRAQSQIAVPRGLRTSLHNDTIVTTLRHALYVEWAKAEANVRKHRVRFEEAALVFDDPLHLTEQERIEGGEYRWQTIGQIFGIVIIVVAHTTEQIGEPDETIRIISARRATPRERKRYEDS